MWKIRNYLLLYFADIGTTYVRWARKQCPYNYTELVYSGRCPYNIQNLVTQVGVRIIILNLFTHARNKIQFCN